jgi:hypothetical protein
MDPEVEMRQERKQGRYESQTDEAEEVEKTLGYQRKKN